MKWIYYIVFFLMLSSFLLFFAFLQNGIAKEKEFLEENIYHLHKITIDLPHVSDENLRKKIDNYITEYKKDFLDNIQDVNIQKDMIYTLNVSYENYSFDNFECYVFYLEIFTGGAHPIPSLWTVNYDLEKKEFVTIDNFIKNDSNFLEKVSKSVRSDLLLDPKAVNVEMIFWGTEPIVTNFQNFVLKNNGILFFFPPYQVAPYSSGVLNVKYDF